MNSYWKGNLIIFTMVLVPTHSGTLEGQSWVKLCQTWSKLTKITK